LPVEGDLLDPLLMTGLMPTDAARLLMIRIRARWPGFPVRVRGARGCVR
jgi:hypothetical protein